ncbi:hypothetical protein MMC31_007912 [Peltigera leucophlebia]|nr:hypothetical protein [Peltigera leucophlebia]
MLKTAGSSAASASGVDGDEAVGGGGADGGIGGNRISAPLTAMLKTGSSAASASGADGDEVTGGGADGGVGRSGGSGLDLPGLSLLCLSLGSVGEVLQAEHSNPLPATPLDDYCSRSKPDFPLCSRALNRPTGPSKSSLDTTFRIDYSQGTAKIRLMKSSLVCLASLIERDLSNRTFKSSTGYRPLLAIASLSDVSLFRSGYRLSLAIASLSNLRLFRPQPSRHFSYVDSQTRTKSLHQVLVSGMRVAMSLLRYIPSQSKGLDKPNTDESLQELQLSSEVQSGGLDPGGLEKCLWSLTSSIGDPGDVISLPSVAICKEEPCLKKLHS